MSKHYWVAEVQADVNREVTRDLLGKDLQAIAVVGLAEEAGEVAGLYKRQLRQNERDDGKYTKDRYIDELGDVLWYLSMCCATVGTSLDEVWEHNRKKLEERYGRA